MTDAVKHKKDMILDAARDLGVEKWTVAEIDQLRRKLLADHGEAGKTGNDYIADVLKAAGWKIQITEREEAEEQFEEEFEDILHFKTLQDAEVSLTRLDELLRRFRQHGERAAVERVMEIARLGKRRAEMISRNRKVEEQKRKEKKEIAEWFRIWLEAPDAFFDWLDVRKASPEFHATFGEIEEDAAIWAAVIPALAGDEAWVLDFFSHLDRVREYCNSHEVEFREAANRCLVIPQPGGEKLRGLIARFAGETFGLRCGAAAKEADATVESELSHRGLDAYQDAYTRYTFCAICEPDDGWVTLLSKTLWPSEIIRRARPALQPFDVHIARPQ